MTGNSPIVFVHYGRSAYLRQTLRAARRSNPGKKVFFLGDETNRYLCPRGVDFLPWCDFTRSRKLDKFRAVFRPIEGARHKFNKQGGTKRWLAFVFERWFVIENFLRQTGIKSFWVFDSDTMIAADLGIREPRFADYQATEQCRGNCLNGLVQDLSVVDRYTEWMIGLYEDEVFLEQQRQRLKVHDGLCFNEMDAWQHFRDANKVRAVPLNVVREGEFFDDALAITKHFEVAATKVYGRIPVKKTFLDSRGGAFAFPLGAPPARMVTLNLSWLPDFVFSRVARICQPTGVLNFDPDFSDELNLRTPLATRLFGPAMNVLRRSFPTVSFR
jgi:hypothetical protein